MDPSPLAILAQQSAKDLRALWPQWFDHAPPKRLRRDLLIRALAYRMQERAQGGLSTATRCKLRALAEAVKTKTVFDVVETRRLTPGTHVIREWGNEMHQVTVEATNFLYRGQRYRSLSEIARRITGTRWSGPVFFGVKPSARGRTSRPEVNG
jgi:hypothetical protein